MALADQPERDAKARRELARAAGVSLIGATSALEEGLGIGEGAGAVTLALVAFAARARRLLRAAYRLIDAGERDAAAPLFRVMNEYLIVGRWLNKVGEAELQVWALDDLRSRLTTLKDVIADPDLDEETKEILRKEVHETEEAIRGYGGAATPTSKRAAKKAGEEPPLLQAMAKEAGLSFVYAFPYRVLSQRDVHASPAAIDSAYDQTERGAAVRPVPQFGLEGYDSYLVGAHLLLDIVRPLAERVPEFDWRPSVMMIGEVLAAIGRADPERTPT